MAVVHLEPRKRGRRWAALVPFLQKAEFDALLLSGNGFRLWGDESPEEAWLRATAAGRAVPAYSEGATAPLPERMESAAAELQRREVFPREYARKAEVRLGLVPLTSLISPQPVADLDYVAELADRLGSDDDVERDFAFAFPTATMPEPMVAGPTVIFNDQTQNIVINPMAEWRRVGDEVHIVIAAFRKPNYVWVAELGARLVLLNGVHKAVAAMKAGRTFLPAVIRSATALPELGIQQPPTFLAYFGGSRPPLVADFLHPMAIALERRPTRTLTRLIIQVDQIPVPE
jgi:hypothetical protein